MRNLLTFAILMFTFSTALQAQQVPNAKDYIFLDTCLDSSENSELGTCVVRQIEICWSATGASNMSSGQCKSEAYRQADNLLNAYYQQIIPTVRRAANQLEGSAYALDWNPLRESQRAWLAVRDTTCNLYVLYAATGPGRQTAIDGCKARLTMQRIGDLRIELRYF